MASLSLHPLHEEGFRLAGGLIRAVCEQPEGQAMLAERLIAHGWTCTPPPAEPEAATTEMPQIVRKGGK